MGDSTPPTAQPFVSNHATVTPHQYHPTTVEIYIPDEFDLSETVRNIFVPFIVITLFFGLIANVLAVFITVKCSKENKEQRLTIPGILVRALLATDLSATAFFLVRGCCYMLYQKTWIQCDLDLASNLLFSWASGLVNMLMSCDRCLALGAPFFYHTHATRGKTYATLAGSVVITILLSFLPVVGFGAYKIYVNGEYFCLAPGDLRAQATDFDYTFNVLFFTLGLGILVISYAANIVVLHQILKLRRRLVVVVDTDLSKTHSTDGIPGPGSRAQSGNNTCSVPDVASHDGAHEEIETIDAQAGAGTSPTDAVLMRDELDVPHPVPSRVRSSLMRHPNQGRTEMRFGAMILVFSVVFSFSWLPFYIQRLVKAITGQSSQISLVVAVYLLTLNHVIDPFVYVLMKRQYRKKLVELGRRWRCLICSGRGGAKAPANGGDVRSVSSAFYGNGHQSLGTAVTSTTVTSWLGYGSAPAQHGMQLPSAPLIQVTAASPSLASENSQQDPAESAMGVISWTD